jgi:diguanylate cyclase (GGDEF)-like protein
MGGLMILTLVLGYALARLWGPMMAMRAGAERDPLTGLYNRRHADAAAESMVRFANRTGARAAFVMMDLDEFKSLNDELGHVDGDRALAAVGAHVSSQIRAGDLAARWGGDEFLLVLLLAADDDPEDVVERIRVGISEALADLFPGRFDLGVTAGFATTDVVGDDVGVLIASADRALVRGKAVAKGYTYALAPQP